MFSLPDGSSSADGHPLSWFPLAGRNRGCYWLRNGAVLDVRSGSRQMQCSVRSTPVVWLVRSWNVRECSVTVNGVCVWVRGCLLSCVAFILLVEIIVAKCFCVKTRKFYKSAFYLWNLKKYAFHKLWRTDNSGLVVSYKLEWYNHQRYIIIIIALWCAWRW
jgi:hypothetical protein